MKKTGKQNDFAERLEAVRAERSTIKAERLRLDHRDEELVREEERILTADRAPSSAPYLVRTKDLLVLLNVKIQGLGRLRQNEAKGFPQPVAAVDGDPRWRWTAIEAWLDGGGQA